MKYVLYHKSTGKICRPFNKNEIGSGVFNRRDRAERVLAILYERHMKKVLKKLKPKAKEPRTPGEWGTNPCSEIFLSGAQREAAEDPTDLDIVTLAESRAIKANLVRA